MFQHIELWGCYYCHKLLFLIHNGWGNFYRLFHTPAHIYQDKLQDRDLQNEKVDETIELLMCVHSETIINNNASIHTTLLQGSPNIRGFNNGVVGRIYIMTSYFRRFGHVYLNYNHGKPSLGPGSAHNPFSKPKLLPVPEEEYHH